MSIMWQTVPDINLGPIEKQYVSEINKGLSCAVVKKHVDSTMIEQAYDWEVDGHYKMATPLKAGAGHNVYGPILSLPEKRNVARASAADVKAIFKGDPTGQFADANIIRIPFSEHRTGALPIVFAAEPEELLFYIPATLTPQHPYNPHQHDPEPWYICMKERELPTYVFWAPKSKPQLPPPTSTNARKQRSQAPTPEVRSVPPTINTEAAAHIAKTKTKAEEAQWEVFDPRLEADPMEFIDYYNTKTNGYHGIRSKMMLREEDIDRVNLVSSCLSHNHSAKEADGKSTANEAHQKATGNPPSKKNVEKLPLKPTTAAGPLAPTDLLPSKPTTSARASPRPAPAPIAHDDPHWVAFRARLDRRRTVRAARITPKPVFDPKLCNQSPAKRDPTKAVVTHALYNEYHRRAVFSEKEVEARTTCCKACGLDWNKCSETRRDHYNQHREEHKEYNHKVLNRRILVEPVMGASQLVWSRSEVPALNWFAKLEAIILESENELLERAETCRVCDAHLDYAETDPEDHYAEHRKQRVELREFKDQGKKKKVTIADTTTAKAVPVVATAARVAPIIVRAAQGPPQATAEDDEISPPARVHTGFPANAPFIVRHEQIHKKAAAKKLSMVPGLAAVLKTPTSASSIKSTHSIDIFEPSGPMYSDVIGSKANTAAMPPWNTIPVELPSGIEGENISDVEADISFVNKHSGTRVPSIMILPTEDEEDKDEDLYSYPPKAKVVPAEFITISSDSSSYESASEGSVANERQVDHVSEDLSEDDGQIVYEHVEGSSVFFSSDNDDPMVYEHVEDASHYSSEDDVQVVYQHVDDISDHSSEDNVQLFVSPKVDDMWSKVSMRDQLQDAKELGKFFGKDAAVIEVDEEMSSDEASPSDDEDVESVGFLDDYATEEAEDRNQYEEELLEQSTPTGVEVTGEVRTEAKNVVSSLTEQVRKNPWEKCDPNLEGHVQWMSDTVRDFITTQEFPNADITFDFDAIKEYMVEKFASDVKLSGIGIHILDMLATGFRRGFQQMLDDWRKQSKKVTFEEGLAALHMEFKSFIGSRLSIETQYLQRLILARGDIGDCHGPPMKQTTLKRKATPEMDTPATSRADGLRAKIRKMRSKTRDASYRPDATSPPITPSLPKNIKSGDYVPLNIKRANAKAEARAAKAAAKKNAKKAERAQKVKQMKKNLDKNDKTLKVKKAQANPKPSKSTKTQDGKKPVDRTAAPKLKTTSKKERSNKVVKRSFKKASNKVSPNKSKKQTTKTETPSPVVATSPSGRPTREAALIARENLFKTKIIG
jgi:hypothetical protein